MVRRKRSKPKHLARKLYEIRAALNLSQTEMLKRLGLEDELPYFSISKNERGTREPTLIEILRYARLVDVPIEVLIDDDLQLPARLPAQKNHQARPAHIKKKNEGLD
ncbi:MAG: helix-turn-helix transcriptional regulator [Blastocatellia bacterium]